MSRGVMCAKSSRLTTSGDTIGELLHELEEKMEVCNHPHNTHTHTHTHTHIHTCV